MDIETMKQLIKTHQSGHILFVEQCMVAERYYKNENDILFKKKREEEESGEQPLRNADNRVSSNFYGLLVNQKASYMFTAPPLFDLGNEEANKQLADFLGDGYAKTCKDLCVNASNCSIAWLHVWHDDENKNYEYAVIHSEEVIPIWSKRLKRKLVGVMRTYKELAEDGKTYWVYEYWDSSICQAYRVEIADTGIAWSTFDYYCMFPMSDQSEPTYQYQHGIGEVPFFPFFNNNIDTNDLSMVKGHIDTYDKVYSGFVNDLEDIQEVIFILTNYGGQDLNEFMRDLKYYKAINLESDGGDDHTGVETLTIQIPVEARDKLLSLCRKCIFEQGQGIDPDPQNFGNSSGVALKYLYSLLELKAGLQETEFKLAFGSFIRCICRLLGIPIAENQIKQTWTRTSVSNDSELADIAQKSVGIISTKTIVKNHPWVENPEDEERQLEEEQQKKQESFNPYGNTFPDIDGGDGDSDSEEL